MIKSIFSKIVKSPIGFEPFVEAIYNNKGPNELLIYFISLIEPGIF